MPAGLSPERVRFLETHLSAQLQLEDHALAAGFLHFCDEWDGLLIDQSDLEFDCCTCKFGPSYNPKTGKVSLCG